MPVSTTWRISVLGTTSSTGLPMISSAFEKPRLAMLRCQRSFTQTMRADLSTTRMPSHISDR